MKYGKVQTNESGTNVLVEHESCNVRHYSHLDKRVLCEKLTDKEIDEEFSKIVLSRKDKVNILMKVAGFAISNCYSEEGGIHYNDLFKYELA